MSDDDFVSKNSTFLLSALTLLSGCFASLLAYALKSRCTRISCWGISCEREPLPAEQVDELDRTRRGAVADVEAVQISRT